MTEKKKKSIEEILANMKDEDRAMVVIIEREGYVHIESNMLSLGDIVEATARGTLVLARNLEEILSQPELPAEVRSQGLELFRRLLERSAHSLETEHMEIETGHPPMGKGGSA